MNFTWQHIQFEDGSNPYICKTETEFDRMKNKYNLEYIADNMWLAKRFEAVSGWLKIQYREITEDMREYMDDKESIQPGFEFEGGFHYLSDFVRTHNNSWGGLDVPDYIHGYDATNIFNPLFIEIDEGGEAVRVYEHAYRAGE